MKVFTTSFNGPLSPTVSWPSEGRAGRDTVGTGYGVPNVPEALITDSSSSYYSYGHTRVASIGKWSWRCTSRAWDSWFETAELFFLWQLNLISSESPSGCWVERVDEQTVGRTDGRKPFIFPFFSFGKGGIQEWFQNPTRTAHICTTKPST